MGQYIPLKSPLVLQRLTSLLGLQTPNSPPPMELWPGILPIVDISGFIRTPKNATAVTDLSVAQTIYVPAFTVPPGKRWKLLVFTRDTLTTSGSIGAISDGVVVVGICTDSLTRPYVMPPDMWLLPGWTIGGYGCGGIYGANQTTNHWIHYLEEDAY